MIRHITTEFTIALVAGVLTLVGMVSAIFGPATLTVGSSRIVAGTGDLWAHGFGRSDGVYVIVLALATVLMGVGSYLRSEQGLAADAALLWTGVIVLTIATLVALPGTANPVLPPELRSSAANSMGVGIYQIPGVLAAMFAGIAGTITHPEPSHRPVLRS